ncbi:hypothetical protein N7517_011068 [Penicillium concentricum]|uniref:Uncharacterized protein n=1 Tax=Penicillium concentricum TaxID=293559 RepID=A0A9W9RBW0_9EURO|nr:uncharacterized protein N7517_011068 [Penicillium concentricum]KAJ5356459.1 hypothetical protein N7517_011068 [Penicillium concentricum]
MTSQLPSEVRPISPILGLEHTREIIFPFDLCESPSEFCESQNLKPLMSKNTRIPSDDPEQQIWIKTKWIYMGQDSAHDLVDGARGSAIWNTNLRVLGFFCCSPATGIYKDYC